MSSYPLLTPLETMLEGKWLSLGNSLVPDNTSLRIEFLTSHALVKLANDSSGWLVLYRDPQDSRYWELSYPDSGEHGGGAPLLRCLDVDEVNRRYRAI